MGEKIFIENGINEEKFLREGIQDELKNYFHLQYWSAYFPNPLSIVINFDYILIVIRF